MEWQSNAQWPLETYSGKYDDGVSTDRHFSREMAQVVCGWLESGGFGGEGKSFPIKTWVSVVESTE